MLVLLKFLRSHSFILAKRKRDDGVEVSGKKKSRAYLSLRDLRDVVGLMPSLGHSLSLHSPPLSPSTIEAPAPAVAIGPVSPSSLAALLMKLLWLLILMYQLLWLVQLRLLCPLLLHLR